DLAVERGHQRGVFPDLPIRPDLGKAEPRLSGVTVIDDRQRTFQLAPQQNDPPLPALSNSHPMHRRRHRAEQIPPAARPWLAPPALRPSMPIANCTAGLSKPRAGEQPPKPGRPRPRPRLIAPPYAPGSTADDAQLLPRHPLQRLLLDCPEGPSFAQRSPPDHTS